MRELWKGNYKEGYNLKCTQLKLFKERERERERERETLWSHLKSATGY